MEDQNVLGTILGFVAIFAFFSISYHVRQYLCLRKEKRLKNKKFESLRRV
jgi:hypothetical protein